MTAHHAERLAETIREELGELIAGELADPRIGLATVTEVKLEPGMRVAHVYVAVAGGAAAESETLAGLMAARGFLRRELTLRLQTRQAPELRFEIDRQDALGARIETLLKRSHRRTIKHHG